jgi:hypothetical protein
VPVHTLLNPRHVLGMLAAETSVIPASATSGALGYKTAAKATPSPLSINPSKPDGVAL